MKHKIINLLPEEIEVHPIVLELEEAGIPPAPTQSEIKRLSKSISEVNQIQPIEVLEKDGKYYRIVGRRRVEAAKIAGVSVRCEIREDIDFDDNDTIVQIHLDENGCRNQMTRGEIEILYSKAQKVLGKDTKRRIKNYMELHEELKNLVNQGVLNIRSDEKLLEELKKLPEDIQIALAKSINPVTITKLKDDKNNDKEILKIVSEKNKEIENLKKTISELEDTIIKLNEEVTEKDKMLNKAINELKELSVKEDSYEKEGLEDLIENLRLQNESLKNEIKNKQKEINELNSKIVELNREMYNEIEQYKLRQENIVEKEIQILYSMLSHLEKSTATTLSQIKDGINSIKIDSDYKRGKFLEIHEKVKEVERKLNKNIVVLMDNIRAKIADYDQLREKEEVTV